MATFSEAQQAAGEATQRAAVTMPGSGHITPLLQNAPALADLIIKFWADPGKG